MCWTGEEEDGQRATQGEGERVMCLIVVVRDRMHSITGWIGMGNVLDRDGAGRETCEIREMGNGKRERSGSEGANRGT